LRPLIQGGKVARMAEAGTRILGEEDWRLYREVRLAALREAPGAFGSTFARERDFTEETWRERLAPRTVFLAEDGGVPRGLIGVVPAAVSAGPAVAASGAEFVSMWVNPMARGHGVGDLLIRSALQWANGQGYRDVSLWVTEHNHHAERLYTRHGFRRTGAVQPVRDGEPDMEFAMSRPASMRLR
jgi:GNAT superfamily N-acetyltransferase